MAGDRNNPDYLELLEEIRRLRQEQERLRERPRVEESTDGTSGVSTPSEAGNRISPQKPARAVTKTEREPPHVHPEQDENREESDEPVDDNQPKPPLRERLRSFYAEHKAGAVFGVLGLALVCILGFFLLRYLRSYENTDDAQIDGYLNGITSRISGHVVRVYVDQNQFVEAGQMLVELDPSDYQTSLEQAQASYQNAVAQLRGEHPNLPIIQTTTQTTISTTQADVATAQAALTAAEQQYRARLADQAQAEANNAKAQRDLVRYRVLAERQEVSREQYDAIVAAAKSQAAAVEAAQAAARAEEQSIDQARAALSQAKTRLSQASANAPRSVAVQQASVEARQAAVLAAKAQVDEANLNLSYTKVYAPVSGVVAQRSVEIGQTVSPGQQLVLISQIYDLWVTANFKETQLRAMRTGQPVEIHVDAFNRKYKGYVQYMPGATGAVTSLLPPQNATGNFVKVVQRLPVRIRFYGDQDREHMLRPGMSVEPKVWLK